MPHPPTLGVLLAGGLARRMGGGDKPLREVAGATMLERAARRLRPQCAGLIVNANGDAARFAALGLPVVPDGVPGFPGPLAGILAALDWAAANRPDIAWLASAAADAPFLPRDLVARLHAARAQAQAPLACARSGGRTHPTIALWPVALRARLRRALEADERAVGRFAAAQGCAEAEWPAEPYDPFMNVNTPEDLAAAEALARDHPDA